MDIVVLTRSELEQFMDRIIEEITAAMDRNGSSKSLYKRWLKSAEVRELLGVSDSKLQKLRIKGILPSSKIGGVHYYEFTKIQALFKGKTCNLKFITNE